MCKKNCQLVCVGASTQDADSMAEKNQSNSTVAAPPSLWKSTRSVRWKGAAATMLAVVLSLVLGHRAGATQYAAVLFGGDYPGPPSFDDHLSLSRAALANNLRTWPNWTAAGATITELPGNTT